MGDRIWISADGELELDIGPSDLSPVNNLILHLRDLPIPICLTSRFVSLRVVGREGYGSLFGTTDISKIGPLPSFFSACQRYFIH